MNSYFRHFEGMGVFIEHNEQFEIQGVDQWLEGKQITWTVTLITLPPLISPPSYRPIYL